MLTAIVLDTANVGTVYVTVKQVTLVQQMLQEADILMKTYHEGILALSVYTRYCIESKAIAENLDTTAADAEVTDDTVPTCLTVVSFG